MKLFHVKNKEYDTVSVMVIFRSSSSIVLRYDYYAKKHVVDSKFTYVDFQFEASGIKIVGCRPDTENTDIFLPTKINGIPVVAVSDTALSNPKIRDAYIIGDSPVSLDNQNIHKRVFFLCPALGKALDSNVTYRG